ncbi:hypothetical protein ACOMHN_014356 [Nucella lapillus]
MEGLSQSLYGTPHLPGAPVHTPTSTQQPPSSLDMNAFMLYGLQQGVILHDMNVTGHGREFLRDTLQEPYESLSRKGGMGDPDPRLLDPSTPWIRGVRSPRPALEDDRPVVLKTTRS